MQTDAQKLQTLLGELEAEERAKRAPKVGDRFVTLVGRDADLVVTIVAHYGRGVIRWPEERAEMQLFDAWEISRPDGMRAWVERADLDVWFRKLEG